jgi:hypothetical protein
MRYVPAPIHSTYLAHADKVMTIGEMIESITVDDNSYFGTGNRFRDYRVSMGNALRETCLRLASGRKVIMLGSEIESVVQAWDFDVTHYGLYSLPEPMDASSDMINSAYRFPYTVAKIADRLNMTVHTMQGYRKRVSHTINGVVLYIVGSTMVWIEDGKSRTYRTKDLRAKRLSKAYAEKFLLSLLINKLDYFTLDPFDESYFVIALFTASNTRNDRDAWRRLLNNANYVITLPYRRWNDGEKWEGEFSDHTYTWDELPTFLDIPKFIMLHAHRKQNYNGFNMRCEPTSRWAVISSTLKYPDYQIPPYNPTEWAKVLGILLRTRLSHSNSTLHKIRRYVGSLMGYFEDGDKLISTTGKILEPAGHLINILLCAHIVPIDVKGYLHLIKQNRQKNYPSVETFEFETHNSLWHEVDDWIAGYHTYTLMAKAFGWDPVYLPSPLIDHF